MTTITIELKGLEQIASALNNFPTFRRKVRQRLPSAVLTVQRRQIKKRLRQTKRGPDGEAWPPMAPATQDSRRRKGTLSLGLLVDTKQLASTMKIITSAGKGMLGSPMPYANAQHFGSRNIPSRPFFGVGSEDIPVLTQKITDWIEERWP